MKGKVFPFSVLNYIPNIRVKILDLKRISIVVLSFKSKSW